MAGCYYVLVVESKESYVEDYCLPCKDTLAHSSMSIRRLQTHSTRQRLPQNLATMCNSSSKNYRRAPYHAYSVSLHECILGDQSMSFCMPLVIKIQYHRPVFFFGPFEAIEGHHPTQSFGRVNHVQSYLLPRSSKARAGVVIASMSSGFPIPASMTRTLTFGFSARRPATTQPAVPPILSLC